MAIKTVGEFAALVERMREAQKAYFKSNGSIYLLQECRKLESEVDACIKVRNERLAREKQPELGMA